MAIAGYNTVGGTEDFNGVNDGVVDGPYTVGSGSTITEFHAHLRAISGAAGTQLFRPLVYADSSGEPGSLIATLAEISVASTDTTGAWRDLTGLSVAVSVNAVWLGLWNASSDYRYTYDTPGGNPGRYKGVLATYSSTGNSPDPWPASTDITTTQQQSIYVVYTPASTAVPSLTMAPIMPGAYRL